MVAKSGTFNSNFPLWNLATIHPNFRLLGSEPSDIPNLRAILGILSPRFGVGNRHFLLLGSMRAFRGPDRPRGSEVLVAIPDPPWSGESHTRQPTRYRQCVTHCGEVSSPLPLPREVSLYIQPATSAKVQTGSTKKNKEKWKKHLLLSIAILRRQLPTIPMNLMVQSSYPACTT